MVFVCRMLSSRKGRGVKYDSLSSIVEWFLECNLTLTQCLNKMALCVPIVSEILNLSD